MEQRSISKGVIYSLCSLGVYALYWFVRLTDEAHAAVGRKTTATGVRALIYTFFTCNIYLFYWMLQMGETLQEARFRRGMADDGSERTLQIIIGGYLILGFANAAFLQESAGVFYFLSCGLYAASLAVIQRSLNDIISFDAMLPIMKAQLKEQSRQDPFFD